jgi:hypothetical protein
VFAVGILINCLSHVPYTLIQGANRAHITAMIHCSIFPFFILVLWLGTYWFGLIGAVASWFVRIIIDALLMFYFGLQTTGKSIGNAEIGKILLVSIVATGLFSFVFVENIYTRLLVTIIGCVLLLLSNKQMLLDLRRSV